MRSLARDASCRRLDSRARDLRALAGLNIGLLAHGTHGKNGDRTRRDLVFDLLLVACFDKIAFRIERRTDCRYESGVEFHFFLLYHQMVHPPSITNVAPVT